MQTSRGNNLKALGIKNAKFSEYCFYMNTNMQRDFQIYISVPLKCKIFYKNSVVYPSRFSYLELSVKKLFLEIFAKFPGKHLYQISFLIKLQAKPKACNFIKKETLAQLFSCGFRDMFKNAILYRTPPVATSVLLI